MNPYAWNLEASVVFIEQPVGVGFSKAFGNLTYNDSNAASDNVKFVKGFMKLFPQFAANDFFISSESYGGHYMPTLASALVDDGGVPNFKGFLVGNPLTFLTHRNYGEFGTYAGHQPLPKPLWEQYEAAGCRRAPGLDPGVLCATSRVRCRSSPPASTRTPSTFRSATTRRSSSRAAASATR